MSSEIRDLLFRVWEFARLFDYKQEYPVLQKLGADAKALYDREPKGESAQPGEKSEVIEALRGAVDGCYTEKHLHRFYSAIQPYLRQEDRPSEEQIQAMAEVMARRHGLAYAAKGKTTHERLRNRYAIELRAACDEGLRQPVRESVGFVEALQEAKKIVAAYPLHRKFIDGTPLENDVAVMMAEFAVKGGKA